MKQFASIVCLCIALLMGGCASTGGSSNSHFIENWVVMRIFSNSMEGVPLSTIQAADDVKFNRLNSPVLSSERESIYFRNRPSELEQYSIITVWYRGSLDRGIYTEKMLERFEITGKYIREKDPAVIARKEREREAAEVQRIQRAAREAERQQPRFSPEGQEYVKRELTQAVGEAVNPANRGKTLFFESDVIMEQGVRTGQWNVSGFFSSGITIMEYYGRSLSFNIYITTILYRVEISNIGFARYVIDSLRE